MDEPKNKANSPNVTEAWSRAPTPIVYSLPELCPECGSKLKAAKVYVGIHPYIYADFTLMCWDKGHEYNFCFPYNPMMAAGYTVFDSTETKRYYTTKTCPFHKDTQLKPVRLYGDLVFSDGTRKIQLRCTKCYYSERRTFTESVNGENAE